ncbi:MAG TPA: hypothetical protein ENN51_09550, partial [candidate division WOR-3 bacterium]|nr:hypothetical protein [candidate division WOR-3 bacterium]
MTKGEVPGLDKRRYAGMMMPMMSLRAVAAALGAAVVLSLSCPGEPPPVRPEFRVPKWRSGETSVYHVVRNDSVLYETRVVLRFDEETIGLPLAPRSVPTVVVTTTVGPAEAPTFFFDSVEAVFRRDSRIALRSHRRLATELASIGADATYEPGRVVIRKETVDGIEEVTRETPGWTLDQDMVRTVLRAVPPDPGAEFRISVVNPIGFRVRNVPVQVLGTRLVVTPTDRIVC